MNTQPIEARCDGCKQTRPLFLYEPDCGMHLGANAFTCPWCSIDRQPLLCVRCWDTRKAREEADPTIAEEARTMELICEGNRRAIAREEADKATCEGIAQATAQTEGSGS